MSSSRPSELPIIDRQSTAESAPDAPHSAGSTSHASEPAALAGPANVLRALASSEARQAAIVETALDCIISIDHEGRVVEFNSAAQRTFGYRREEVLGKELSTLIIPPALRERHHHGLAHYLATGEGPVLGKRVELPALRKDGTEILVELAVNPIHTDPPMFTAYLRDITERRRSEEQLRRSNETLHAMIEASPGAIIASDLDGRVTLWNKAAERIFGWTADEVMGQLLPMLPRDKFPEFHANLRRMLQGEFFSDLETQRVRKDGTRIDVSISTAPMHDAQGKLEGIMAVILDISERKRATEALLAGEQRFARFMQHLSGLAWIKDLQGRYVYVNDAAEKAFRRPRSELYGKTDGEIFPAATAAQFRGHDQQALASGTGVSVIETLADATGVLRHSIVSKFPISGPDGEPILVGGMAIDITDRMRAEEALREADRLKDEFLAMLAHELRNPLAPIRNALHIMKQPAASGDEARQVREMAERQVQHMAVLLDDLLDVSRISRGRIELRKEAVDLAAVAHRTIEAILPSVESHGHELTISLSPERLWVEGDSHRLEQILTNLLNNSVKYTDPGGQIRLALQKEGEQIVIRVRDTGIGIAREMLPRIFDLFVQAERRLDRSKGGVGIGLTLVKRLVEMHGGTVEAHSAGPGLGSEFVVHLPALPGGGAALPKDQDPHPRGRKLPRHRILVVDDNKDAAISMAMLLKVSGQEVQAVHDGPAALEAADAFRPQIVFLDIGMPGMDGYEVARRLRQKPEHAEVVLIALTGWGQEEDRRRSKEAGFDHHFVKPAEPKVIQELLARH